MSKVMLELFHTGNERFVPKSLWFSVGMRLPWYVVAHFDPLHNKQLKGSSAYPLKQRPLNHRGFFWHFKQEF